ncbi:hypothetical protein DTL21_10935 [Bremerella cremea]|uniref:Peptidase C39-like domain-containing protein n=1 Tax=Blastopirellula marina TaxID=124 RepID=A0A2S8FT22_9BACT|nr:MULTISPECIES: hypothetical protein [Pirellulaceae]PQO35332.1 hypothetical protein C5Y83_10930 [Blastopirellula marina]RCS48282.1 hypothetical protein DTL21_10935 [Bremerella cremea]
MDRRQAAAGFLLLGCCLVDRQEATNLVVKYFRPQKPDPSRPPADVPFPLRVKNYWGGSCYHASTQVALRWADQGAIADNWRQSFGRAASTWDIAEVLDHYGIPYKRTQHRGYGAKENGDIAVLNYAHDHRLVAAITYFSNHAISFLGWVQKDNVDMACLLDNNRINGFIFVEKQRFLWNWRNTYSGGAIVPLVDPPPPKPYDPLDFVEVT